MCVFAISGGAVNKTTQYLDCAVSVHSSYSSCCVLLSFRAIYLNMCNLTVDALLLWLRDVAFTSTNNIAKNMLLKGSERTNNSCRLHDTPIFERNKVYILYGNRVPVSGWFGGGSLIHPSPVVGRTKNDRVAGRRYRIDNCLRGHIFIYTRALPKQFPEQNRQLNRMLRREWR